MTAPAPVTDLTQRGTVPAGHKGREVLQQKTEVDRRKAEGKEAPASSRRGERAGRAPGRRQKLPGSQGSRCHRALSRQRDGQWLKTAQMKQSHSQFFFQLVQTASLFPPCARHVTILPASLFHAPAAPRRAEFLGEGDTYGPRGKASSWLTLDTDHEQVAQRENGAARRRALMGTGHRVQQEQRWVFAGKGNGHKGRLLHSQEDIQAQD